MSCRSTVKFVLFIGLFLGCSITATAQEKRYIVRFRSDVSDTPGFNFFPNVSLPNQPFQVAFARRPNKRLGDKRTLIMNLDSIALRSLKRTGRVESLEEDSKVKAFFSPDDPGFVQDLQYGLSKINAPAAWDLSVGNSSVVIGVIDTGIDLEHPDLRGNLWINTKEIPDNGKDDDGNGYHDDYFGYNFDGSSSNPDDDNMHGTHVAGTVGALGNNGRGVAGVNFNVQLMALKALDKDGSGYVSSVAEAVYYAIAAKDHGIADVSILSLSLGGDYSKELAQAIQQASTRGILVMAAAGNDGVSTPSYPASLPYNNVISVAASGPQNGLADFSNYGAKTVDLAAPGVDILSTIPSDYVGAESPYGYLSGTSMATPFVSGVAGLIKSVNSSLSGSQIRSILLSTVTPLASLDKKTVTGGLLNAEASLQSALATAQKGSVFGRVASKSKGKGISGTQVTLKGPRKGSKTAVTALDGSFLFDNLEPGNYKISVKKQGLIFKIKSQIVKLDQPILKEVLFAGRALQSSSSKSSR